MRLVRSIDALPARAAERSVMTIGAFDGLHLGHRAIFRQARQIAASRGERLVTLTFEPTPAEYFARGEPPARLTCFRERFEELERLGVDELVCPHFREVNAEEHRRFVERVAVGGLAASHIVVGDDFRYGAKREGTIETLRAAGEECGFEVTVVPPVFHDGLRVSSTRIREALAAGELEAAGRMLGRDYSMSGRVVHGLGLGRDLGFPTANVNLKRRRAPVDGIFAVQIDGLGSAPFDGVASVGSRPTVGGGKTLLEVFIFDFDGDVYGAYITIRFKARIRSEEHFSSIEALKEQMGTDVELARAALANRIA